jgi:hypothetical protein
MNSVGNIPCFPSPVSGKVPLEKLRVILAVEADHGA